MKTSIVALLFLAGSVGAQVPTNIAVQILKAEDARRYDKTLEDLMTHPNEQVRIRAALAAGRIGNEAAIPAVAHLLEKEQSAQMRAMAAFALGEIESIKAADVILSALKAETLSAAIARSINTDGVFYSGLTLAKLLEAAGKIAAANPKEEKFKELGATILQVLNDEVTRGNPPLAEVIRLGLTAVLRARPAGAEETVRKFLAHTDPNIVADALNTLARLKAKNSNRDARDLLQTHVHAVVRANAARVLGAAEDKEAVDILIKAATSDTDSRVRVSAIRALGNLKDAKAAEKLLERGEKLLIDYKKSKFANPVEKNEVLELATVSGRLLTNSGNDRAYALLSEYARPDKLRSPEILIAGLRIAPGRKGDGSHRAPLDWQGYRTMVQIFGEFAAFEPTTPEGLKLKEEAPALLRKGVELFLNEQDAEAQLTIRAAPEIIRAFAKFKTPDLSDKLRGLLATKDVFVRATAAELLGEQPNSKENVEALKTAFNKALLTDKDYNDAQLAILDALFKLDKKEAVGTLMIASGAPDHLVRKKAFELLADKDLQKDFPGIAASLENARKKGRDQVLPYNAAFGTKLGQILNTDADYRRAALRKNGNAKALFTTEKGSFTIDLLPEGAPLTVDNFIKLAKANFFNGLEVHRVVPNFVMQDGDPRGDGNGGPGWSIRCEVNMIPYERGAVGMALSGKDTGGSQWFVTHSPQPHLDGGYTVFGRVNETDMKVVDNIVRGDKLISVKIVEGISPQKGARNAKK